MERSPSFRIALSGILLAFAAALIFMGAMIPGIDLTLFMLSSLLTAIIVIEIGIGGSVAFFAAASLLTLIIVPNKIALIPYICFFGYWPILKYLIERIRKGTLQIICKCAFFAILLSIGLLGFKELLFPETGGGLISDHGIGDLPLIALIPAGILFMLLYDYILSLIIRYYFRRFQGPSDKDLKLS